MNETLRALEGLTSLELSDRALTERPSVLEQWKQSDLPKVRAIAEAELNRRARDRGDADSFTGVVEPL
jgi:hypothetical protein